MPRREHAAEIMLAEATREGVVFDRQAITFQGLRSRVAAAAGAPEPELPGRLAVRIALRAVLEEVDLAPFGAAADGPGFLSAIERAIGELRMAGVGPERLAEVAADPISEALAGIHLRALEAVAHPADVAWELAGAARQLSDFPSVTIFGYDDFDPTERALIDGLAAASDVEIVVPFAAERHAFEARRGRGAALAAGAAQVVDHSEPAPPGPPALARALFEDGAPLEAPPPVRLVGAAGTRGMLRAAVQEALRAREAGTALARIALVVPRLAELRDDLDRLLDAWGVPARRATQVRVLEAPLALALTHLLHLGEMDGDGPGALDHLLGWLRTPYSGAEQAEVDAFEVATRRGGLVRRGELLPRWDGEVIQPARRLVRAAGQGPRAQIAALLEHGWAALRRASEGHAVPTRADLRDRAALGALAGLAGAFEGDDEPAGPPEHGGRTRGPLPPGVLGELVADLTFTERAGPAGGLDLHDFASIRGRRYELVVICGLDGDGYPTRPGPDALLGPLRGRLAGDLAPRAPGTSESRLRFVHAVDAAALGLSLVRRLVDDDGREVAPSPYWVEAARLLGRGVDDLDDRTGARGEVEETAESAPSEREALRAIALEGGVVPGPLQEAACRRVREVGVPADAFSHVDRLRVTELERFLRCPYGWLRDGYLRPAEIDRPLDPRFEGSLGHAVLQRLYERMQNAGEGPCDAQSLARYREVLAEVLPEVADQQRPPGAGAVYDALIERLGRHLSAMLGREAALGSAMVPRFIEQRMEDAVLAADIAPGLVVSGALDRLDLTPDGRASLVVDYKRRAGEFKHRTDEASDRLQLPLYGVMAQHTLVPEAEPIGGIYLGILTASVEGAVRDDVPEAPKVKGARRVSPERWHEITEQAVEAAREAVAGIRAGELEAPPESGCDRWCPCEDLWR